MELYSDLLVKNLQKVRNDITPTFDAYFYEKEPIIRQLIKERWLLGKRPDGSEIGEYHSTKYAQEKYKQNSKAGLFNVDLIDTGELVSAIKISLFSEGFEIFSTDSKFNKIADKYGEDNFNITDKEEEELISEISQKTIEYLYSKYI